MLHHGVGRLRRVRTSSGAFTPTPRIVLLGASIPEDAEIGDLVGTLSVVNGSGSYTFTLTAGGDLFAIDGDRLEVGAALTAGIESVTVEADNGVDVPISRTFEINVTEVAPSIGDALLLTTGDYFLLTDGGKLLLASAPSALTTGILQENDVDFIMMEDDASFILQEA